MMKYTARPEATVVVIQANIIGMVSIMLWLIAWAWSSPPEDAAEGENFCDSQVVTPTTIGRM